MKKPGSGVLLISCFLLLFFSIGVFSQKPLERIEPPFWWTGMENKQLQLLVYGKEIANYNISIEHPGISLLKINKTDNSNYVFIDLVIDTVVNAGKFEIKFSLGKKNVKSYFYELKSRKPGAKYKKGFDNSDAIYLLMPDRFSNGDKKNDNFKDMPDSCKRSDPDSRHGGDMKGILNHLDYIQNLGLTAIWITPLLENNMKKYSYHGYATTDFYKVDPRFGSNNEYIKLIDSCHFKGLKVIMDMIFNHCGLEHWWMKDLPSPDWIHQFNTFTRSNYRSETIMDPYASEYDKNIMMNGWFDVTMPDLNQKNKFLANYLIQNCIWWIEFSGIDGIRMDTYPYSDQEFMAEWMLRINKEYPNFNIVGETWLQRESHTAWFQGNSFPNLRTSSNLKSVTDFPMQSALTKAFNESDGWTDGLARLYYVLAQDFLYPDPDNTVIFADNHDLFRFFSSVNKDLSKWKMAMAFLLTTRGIPMIYYGTEILMDGTKYMGDGGKREDFPGGWAEDTINAFTEKGRTPEQSEAFNYLKKLLNYRKENKVLHNGKLLHFFPNNGVYVYFRYNENNKIMVILNNNSNEISLDLERFAEQLNDKTMAKDIVTQKEITFGKTLLINKKSALILELK